MEALVKEVNRFKGDARSTITQLHYVPSVKLMLCSESGMFGFDWTGTSRAIPEDKLIQPHKPHSDYKSLASCNTEHEYGVTTTEYFGSVASEPLIVSGCIDGSMHSFTLTRSTHEVPVFK